MDIETPKVVYRPRMEIPGQERDAGRWGPVRGRRKTKKILRGMGLERVHLKPSHAVGGVKFGPQPY